MDGYPCVYPRPHSPAKYIDRSGAWIMKKEYGGGGTSSWTRLYTIDMYDVPRGHRYCKPLLFSRTREMVLLQVGGSLFWYDLEKKILEEVDIFGKPSGFSTAISLGNLHLLDGDPVIPS